MPTVGSNDQLARTTIGGTPTQATPLAAAGPMPQAPAPTPATPQGVQQAQAKLPQPGPQQQRSFYLPGQGPVTGQVPNRSPMKPSPQTPQPDSPLPQVQLGQFAAQPMIATASYREPPVRRLPTTVQRLYQPALTGLTKLSGACQQGDHGDAAPDTARSLGVAGQGTLCGQKRAGSQQRAGSQGTYQGQEPITVWHFRKAGQDSVTQPNLRRKKLHHWLTRPPSLQELGGYAQQGLQGAQRRLTRQSSGVLGPGTGGAGMALGAMGAARWAPGLWKLPASILGALLGGAAGYYGGRGAGQLLGIKQSSTLTGSVPGDVAVGLGGGTGMLVGGLAGGTAAYQGLQALSKQSSPTNTTSTYDAAQPAKKYKLAPDDKGVNVELDDVRRYNYDPQPQQPQPAGLAQLFFRNEKLSYSLAPSGSRTGSFSLGQPFALPTRSGASQGPSRGRLGSSRQTSAQTPTGLGMKTSQNENQNQDPFWLAQGFARRCQAAGLDFGQTVQKAKQAADAFPELAEELAPLIKEANVGAVAPGLLRRGATWAARFLPKALGGVDDVARGWGPGMQGAAAAGAAGRATSGVGGWAPGMAAQAPTMSGWQRFLAHPATRFAQRTGGGYLAGTGMGMGLDQMAQLGGYDTNFADLGGMIGAGIRAPGANRLAAGLGRASKALTARGFNRALPQARRLTDVFTAHNPLVNPLNKSYSLGQRLQAGATWGGLGASGIHGFAQARGQEAALDTANQIANGLGFENIEQLLESPAAQALATYNQQGLPALLQQLGGQGLGALSQLGGQGLSALSQLFGQGSAPSPFGVDSLYEPQTGPDMVPAAVSPAAGPAGEPAPDIQNQLTAQLDAQREELRGRLAGPATV